MTVHISLKGWEGRYLRCANACLGPPAHPPTHPPTPPSPWPPIQARTSGTYAAHCMAGIEEQTGSGMAFELFTHVTHFMGQKVVLLGLYNGQKLDAEPAEDIVTYSRVTEVSVRVLFGVCVGLYMAGHWHEACASGWVGVGRSSACRQGLNARVLQEPERTFVRVLLLRGRVQGVVLIGETGEAACIAQGQIRDCYRRSPPTDTHILCVDADLEEIFENLILDQLDVGLLGPSLLDPDIELDHIFD